MDFISAKFSESPDLLVRYIGYAYLHEGVGVVSRHMEQLAKMTNKPIIIKGRIVAGLPLTFMCPSHVDNIGDIMDVATNVYATSETRSALFTWSRSKARQR